MVKHDMEYGLYFFFLLLLNIKIKRKEYLVIIARNCFAITEVKNAL